MDGGTVKPYYDEDGIVIYHGDCREVVSGLGSIDIVLSDPPYGISYQSSRRTGNDRKPRIHGDDKYPAWVCGLDAQIATLVFCRWDSLYSMPKPKSLIVWDKCTHSMGDLGHEFGRQWEAIAFYPGPRHRFLMRPVDVIRCLRVPPNQLLHPN